MPQSDITTRGTPGVEVTASKNSKSAGINKYTSQLVPPVQYELTQEGGYKLPHVGFQSHNAGDTYPVQARIKITLAQGEHRQLVSSTWPL